MSGQPKQKTEREDSAWREFPQFEKVLGSETPPAVMEKIEKTCRQLDEIIQSGSAADKARAKAGMTAYGRTLDLLKKIGGLREQMTTKK